MKLLLVQAYAENITKCYTNWLVKLNKFFLSISYYSLQCVSALMKFFLYKFDHSFVPFKWIFISVLCSISTCEVN